jgi:ribosomal protein RSM22 (predicted rRNA methylase)
LPATYAAITAALLALQEQRPEWQPRSVLDLGAGPGTGLWSATTVWPSIARATAMEAVGGMIELGQALARRGPPAVRDATWVQADVADAASGGLGGAAGGLRGSQGGLGGAPVGQFDLVILAYVLPELDADARDRAVDRAGEETADPGGSTVAVEPGTPEGYRRVLRARERLLARGGFVTAPCPHDALCPLPESDWCHFSVRLPRTSLHRAAKQGSLGYEDEKLAYVAVSRQATARADARVLRHPQVRPRNIGLTLCTPAGVEVAVVTKSDREGFRRARKAAWGDGFVYTPEHESTGAESP